MVAAGALVSRHHRGSGIAKGAEWEQQRQHAMRQGGWRCSKCGKAGRLEVHHIIPISEGGTNDPENLTPLCRECHINIHRRQVSEREQAWETHVKEMRQPSC